MLGLVVLIESPIVLFIYFLIGLSLYAISRLRIDLALKNLRPFIWLFVLTIGLHVLFTRGSGMIRIPLVGLQISQEGLIRGFYYILRIATFVILAALLTLTTSPIALTDGIERFLRPFRRIGVPAHEIAMMISISLRFVPILLEDADRIQKAQISRGSRFDGNVIQRVKHVFPIIIPLFLSTFRRADDLAVAMDSRCYRGGEGRTSLYELKFSWPDAVALSTVIILGIPILLLR